MSTGEAAVRAVADRQAVTDVPLTYARGIDRRDWVLVRSCFTADAQIEGSRMTAPVDDYLGELRKGVEYYPTTMHFMGNQLATVDGDTAQVETYAVAYHWMGQPAGSPHEENLIVGVRYHDELVRTPQGWKVAVRRVSPDWRQGSYPQT